MGTSATPFTLYIRCTTNNPPPSFDPPRTPLESPHQLLADRQQIVPLGSTHLGIMHVQALHRLDDDARDDESRVVLVIGRHHVPRRGLRAGSAQTVLVNLDVLVPELSLAEVGLTEFPILVRLIDPCQKAFSLLLLREMEVEFEDTGSVALEVILQVDDETVPPLPNCFATDKIFSLRSSARCSRTMSTSS